MRQVSFWKIQLIKKEVQYPSKACYLLLTHHHERSPVIGFLEFSHQLKLRLLESFLFVTKLDPVCVEIGHELLRCRIVYLPQTHNQRIGSCNNKCTLKTVYPFTIFYISQPCFTCAKHDEVCVFKIEVHCFIGREY